MMNWNEVKQNLLVGSTWMRGLFMVIYAILLWVAKIVIITVVVFQFLSMLISGTQNRHLLSLGQSLSVYVYQIYAFLLYNTDTMPFPLSTWPKDTEQPTSSMPNLENSPRPKQETEI